jgi:hypothetical protein
MSKIKAFLAREWAMVSTKFGSLIGVLSLVLEGIRTAAPQYAQYDQRIAYAGMVSGILLMIYREKSNG